MSTVLNHYPEVLKRFVLDCVHTMPAHFENGEKFDG